MSSLAVFTPQPDLRETLASLRRELAQATERADTAEKEAASERRKRIAMEKGIASLRLALSPVHEGLLMIFGEMDALGVGEPSGIAPKNSAAWEQWKQKLGGAAAKIIDILHVHGELDHRQLAIHIGTNRLQTVYDAVSKLNKAGIINKNGGKVSLKQL
jgi:hypothetical protein